MIKRLLLIVLFVFVASPAFAVNDFSSCSDAKALWKLDNGALTTDSKGTNTLTDNNTVGTDTGNKQEGDASASFTANNSEYFDRTDANLDSGFPLKSGETNYDFTITFWVYELTPAASRGLLGKWDTASNQRSLLVQSNSGTFRVYIGHSSGATPEQWADTYSMSTSTWYHVGITFCGTPGGTDACGTGINTGDYKIHIYEDGVGVVVDGDTAGGSGTASNQISITTAPFSLGAYYVSGSAANFLNGNLDEVVVFDSILSTDDIDAIRAGTYSCAGATTTTTTLAPTTTTTTLAPTTTTTTLAVTTTTTTLAPTTTTTTLAVTTTTTTLAPTTTTTTLAVTTTTTTLAPTTTTTLPASTWYLPFYQSPP